MDDVAKAMALLWTHRPRTAISHVMPLLGLKGSHGRSYSQDDVRRALVELRERGWLAEMPGRDGYFCLRDDIRGRLYREVLDEIPVATLRDALRQLNRLASGPIGYHWPLYDASATVVLVRLELFAGTSAREIAKLRDSIQRTLDWNQILWMAALPAFDAALFARITPEWRWELAFAAVAEACLAWRADMMPICEWAIAKLDTERQHMPESLHLALAELLVHRGDQPRAQHALGTLKSGAADALRACMLVQAGRWSEAQLAFEAALKLRQIEIGARKRILPVSVAWFYPLVLLAQQTPKHLELARKFCLGEAGKRNPDSYAGGACGCTRSAHVSAMSHSIASRSSCGCDRPRMSGWTGSGRCCSRHGSDAMPWGCISRSVARAAGLPSMRAHFAKPCSVAASTGSCRRSTPRKRCCSAGNQRRLSSYQVHGSNGETCWRRCRRSAMAAPSGNRARTRRASCGQFASANADQSIRSSRSINAVARAAGPSPSH